MDYQFLRINMETLLITGGPNTGKSTLIREVTEWLISDRKYHVVEENDVEDWSYSDKSLDFSMLITNNQKNILIHSATDDEFCIEKLTEFIEKVKLRDINIDILLTTCRRYDDEYRQYMCQRMGWTNIDGNEILDNNRPVIEIALHKIRYDNFEKTERWYKLHMGRIAKHILSLSPYDI